jgi:hypothetical protein
LSTKPTINVACKFFVHTGQCTRRDCQYLHHRFEGIIDPLSYSVTKAQIEDDSIIGFNSDKICDKYYVYGDCHLKKCRFLHINKHMVDQEWKCMLAQQYYS